MVKPKKKTSRVKNQSVIERLSSQVPSASLVMIKPQEQTSIVENPTFVQNLTTQPMSLPASDFEGSTHVSSERESLLEFRYGINTSRPDEDICTGNEPMLCGKESTQYILDGMHRLNVNNPPSVQNPMTQPMKLPASDIEGRAQVSPEVESLFEFPYGMNASSKPAEDIHTGNEPMLGGIGSTEHLLDRMHRLNVNNPPFVQNPMTQWMKLPASDIEGRSQVSFEVESLFVFPYGMNASSKPAEFIHTGNEPMLGGIGSNEHLLDRMHRLNVNNPPYVQNPMTQRMKLPASDIEGRAQVSPEVESLFVFPYGMNASSKPAEDIHTGNEPMLGGIGSTEHLLDRRNRLLSLNIPTPCEDPNLGYELSSNNRENVGMGLLTTGNYRDNSINKVLPGLRYEDRMGKEFPSNRQDGDFDLNEDPLDKRVVDVAKQLLSACNENIQQDENPDCTVNDFSVEYLKLYQETSPENYDFALNIMAHIEFLNDSSWTTTVSYLEENVKRIVTRIWNNLHINFNNTMNLQGLNPNTILKVMMDFNQWTIDKKFEFKLFLSCCILICQLGVIARKGIFKDASFYAICLLRDRMKVLKFENLVQYMFDIVLKDYAKRQCNM